MQNNQIKEKHFAVILDGEVVTWFSFLNNELAEQQIAIYSSNPTIVPVDIPPTLGSKWDGNKIIDSKE
jgi:hypothetical protein